MLVIGLYLLNAMTRSNQSSSEVKPAASFSEVLDNERWGPDLRKAAQAGSVAMVEANEQPSPEIAAPSAAKPRRPR